MKFSNFDNIKKHGLSTLNVIAYFVLIYISVKYYKVPSSEFGESIFSAVKMACGLGFGAAIIVTFMRNGTQADFFRVTTRGFLLLLITIMVTGNIVDPAIAEPKLAIIWLSAISAFVLIFKLSINYALNIQQFKKTALGNSYEYSALKGSKNSSKTLKACDTD
ncbi:TPA: hypothetical protein ACIVGF_002887 [Salmonella enterica subsp. enterica serovar 16:l,v:-]|nr:hypothetical protein [Salmonella enterica]